MTRRKAMAGLIGLVMGMGSAPAPACTDGVVELPGIYSLRVMGGRILPLAVGITAGRHTVLRLGTQNQAERWEIAERGEAGPLRWRAEPLPDQTGMVLRLWGEEEGRAEIPARYHPAGRDAIATAIAIAIRPPLPSSPPPLVVERDETRGRVSEGREFRLRVTAAPPQGDRWTVREAVADMGHYLRSIPLTPDPSDPAMFSGVAAGRGIRIVMVPAGGGSPAAAPSLTIRLAVEPAPKC